MWSNSCFWNAIRPRDRKTFIAVVFLGIIIIIFLSAYISFGEESKNGTLSLVIIVFRHGEKIPNSYPNDPYRNYNWGGDPGDLTNKGKLQTYELGKNLRKRYDSFLSNLFSVTEVNMKSSYKARVQMSGQTLLAGLFPPRGQQIWNPNLLWQPIPTNPIPRKYDNIIAAKAVCPAFSEEKLRSDEEVGQERTTSDKELFHYLEKNVGKSVKNISDVGPLSEILSIQKGMGFKLPDWANTVFPDPMEHLAALNFASFTRTSKLKRLQSGPLIKEWVNLLREKVNGRFISKLNLYAGHDLTIINAVRGLGMDLTFRPKFGAALAIELHSIHKHYFVTVNYFESVYVLDPQPLSIPGCSLPCSLETFLNIFEPLIPNDWENECRIS